MCDISTGHAATTTARPGARHAIPCLCLFAIFTCATALLSVQRSYSAVRRRPPLVPAPPCIQTTAASKARPVSQAHDLVEAEAPSIQALALTDDGAPGEVPTRRDGRTTGRISSVNGILMNQTADSTCRRQSIRSVTSWSLDQMCYAP